MKIKTIDKFGKIKGKKVFLRVDFNVPVKAGKVVDDFKIIRQLQTIRYLLKNDCSIVIGTHLGQPKPGEANRSLSTRPVAAELSRQIKREVRFVPDVCGLQAGTAAGELGRGELLMLENLRFEAGEARNSKVAAKALARLAEIYVNEAFGAAHREHASLSAIRKFLPAYAGFNLAEEVANLEKIMNPKKPLIMVLGGAKLKTKLPLIKNLHKKAYKILLGGVLANNVLAARGFPVGRSLLDEESIDLAKSLKTDKIILPLDAVVGAKSKKWRPRARNVYLVEDKDYIFDIGPRTIGFYSRLIREAQSIVWNGPLGMFEDKAYSHGTLAVSRTIAARSRGRAFGLVGGGETLQAVRLTKMHGYIDWLSTGGGAMLTYLSGKAMPGLKGLLKTQ